MNLKIISDGTITKLVNADTGEMIHLVQKLTFKADANNTFSTVNIELIDVPVEIQDKATISEINYVSGEVEDYEAKVKISSPKNKYCFAKDITVSCDDKTLNSITEIHWEATPKKSKTNIKKYKL